MANCIQVVGGTGSGKSTFSAKLAAKLEVAHIELDDLFWLDNWQESTGDEFRKKISTAIDGAPDGWVMDGSYSRYTKGVIDDKIDTLIYLDIPIYITIPRIIFRSLMDSLAGRVRCNGNRETLTGRINLIRWAIKSRAPRAERIAELKKQKTPFELKVFSNNKSAYEWLETL